VEDHRGHHLSAPFFYHAYCDSPFWFVSYERSWAAQGNKKGTAHPNAAGHAAYANLIRQAIVLDQPSTPYRQLTVTIHALKAAPAAGSPPATVDLTMYEDQAGYQAVTRRQNVPRNGQWTPVPAAAGTFLLDVYALPPHRGTPPACTWC